MAEQSQAELVNSINDEISSIASDAGKLIARSTTLLMESEKLQGVSSSFYFIIIIHILSILLANNASSMYQIINFVYEGGKDALTILENIYEIAKSYVYSHGDHYDAILKSSIKDVMKNKKPTGLSPELIDKINKLVESIH